MYIFRNKLRKYDKISDTASGWINYRIMNQYRLKTEYDITVETISNYARSLLFFLRKYNTKTLTKNDYNNHATKQVISIISIKIALLLINITDENASSHVLQTLDLI